MQSAYHVICADCSGSLEVNMTYEEAKKFIDDSNQYGSVLGLETITELLKRLSNPQEKLNVIHVAGTNGKGSTAAFIAAILAAEGYRTGRYLSPSVFHYREKIQISQKSEEHSEIMTEKQPEDERIESKYITQSGLTEAISEIKPVCEAMVRDGFSHPTCFEIETAMAFMYFVWQQVDFAVIEVGLGGRLDATNVVRPVCSVITSISMDHMQYLGDTIEDIAKEKAGIIKKGAPVVTCNRRPEVLQVLKNACLEAETDLVTADRTQVLLKKIEPEDTIFGYLGQEYSIRLLGEYQIDNALNAIHAVVALRNQGYPVSNCSIQIGLKQAVWRGRFDILSTNPYFILDGAHNEEAAIQLKKAIELYFFDRRVIGIMGVFADKEYGKILDVMVPQLSMLITITPASSRALEASLLAEEARCRGIVSVITANTVSQALAFAYEEASDQDVIIAFGSLSFLGEIYENVIPHPDSVVERC